MTLFKTEVPKAIKQKRKNVVKCENTRYKISFFNTKTRTIHATFMNKTRRESEEQLKDFRKEVANWCESGERPNCTTKGWVLI